MDSKTIKRILFIRNKILTLKSERRINKRDITDKDLLNLISHLDDTLDIVYKINKVNK